MSRTSDVAIVGAGVAGLTLATSLIQKSLSVEVFEQDTQLREIGAGVAIGGNATRLLDRLGVDLSRVANVPPTLEIRRWTDGALLWTHPIGEWYRQIVGAPLLMLHRATLQRMLAAAVPMEHLHLGHRLVELSEEVDGVRLRFDNGADAVAGLVVGVDGVNSVTRRYVCEGVGPRYSGEIGFRGLIPIDRCQEFPNPTSLHLWAGPGTHAVCYGLDGGASVNLLAVYRPTHLPAWTERSNRAPATTADAFQIFEGYGWDGRILDLLRRAEGDTSFWALVDLPRLPRWSRGHVVLLGDAAHAPLPHQGQGAGLAIEDAYALGELLGHGGVENSVGALETFERLRKGRAARVQAYSRLSGRAIKYAGKAAERRDATWPSLPEHIAWIHSYRLEELLQSPAGQLTAAPL